MKSVFPYENKMITLATEDLIIIIKKIIIIKLFIECRKKNAFFVTYIFKINSCEFFMHFRGGTIKEPKP